MWCQPTGVRVHARFYYPLCSPPKYWSCKLIILPIRFHEQFFNLLLLWMDCIFWSYLKIYDEIKCNLLKDLNLELWDGQHIRCHIVPNLFPQCNVLRKCPYLSFSLHLECKTLFGSIEKNGKHQRELWKYNLSIIILI